jgi:glutaredoxin 3
MSKALVYSSGNCPYCVKAKSLLKLKNLEIEEIIVGKKEDLKKDIEKEKFKADLSEKLGRVIDTVPQIFIDDVYIGGFDDLNEYYERQEIASNMGDMSDFEL